MDTERPGAAIEHRGEPMPRTLNEESLRPYKPVEVR